MRRIGYLSVANGIGERFSRSEERIPAWSRKTGCRSRVLEDFLNSPMPMLAGSGHAIERIVVVPYRRVRLTATPRSGKFVSEHSGVRRSIPANFAGAFLPAPASFWMAARRRLKISQQIPGVPRLLLQCRLRSTSVRQSGCTLSIHPNIVL